MKLLPDQGMPFRSALLLRNLEIDAVHTREMGLATADDSKILDFARNEDRIVVTLDSDFHTILALSYAHHPSVIRIRIEGLKTRQMTELLLEVLRNWEQELSTGYALSVQENGVRAHKLPLIRL